MITLLSLLIGFITSNIPSLLKFFQSGQDNKHELDMLALQLEYNKANLDAKMEEMQISGDYAALQTRLLTTNIGNPWIDGINALVRPMYAFGLLGLYFLINLAYYIELKEALDNGTLSAGIFASLMWTESDQCFLSAIVGYYFGGRLSEKMR